MRDIKFRAWDLDNHEMYHSHLEESNGEDKIDWRIDCDGVFFEEIQIIDTCPGGKGHKQSREWRKPNQIIMQYTGLHDKNGKEIYEGDVLDIKGATCNEYDFKGVVSFYDGTFCLASLVQSEPAKKHGYLDRVRFWKDGCHDHYSLEMIESFEMEVLGNIHENPELLTETRDS